MRLLQRARPASRPRTVFLSLLLHSLLETIVTKQPERNSCSPLKLPVLSTALAFNSSETNRKCQLKKKFLEPLDSVYRVPYSMCHTLYEEQYNIDRSRGFREPE